ncbi:metallophosphoesterase [Bradyrhizobium sp. 62]|uniref:metallophosphoesterase family protein n=1 Tax=Bradyrhizobium sp. 62 TaxID=1043588 RepID=UPI001FF9A2BC|nr:metallophosphoesterase [Bradyrhizobium sp. 62]MCK1367601.1 metallophosphoesterase [Bradyrhizobium sp. 62]
MTTFKTPCRANGDLFGPTGNSVSFGFITDTHHDPAKATSLGKYYQDAVNKVTASVAAFNAIPGLSFVFQNGDFIDSSADAATALVDLAAIKGVFDGANAPRYHNVGNHELFTLTKAQTHGVTGQSAKWYSFAYGGVTFIVLDGNFTADDDTADLSPSTPSGSVDYTRSPFISYIPPTQRAWLAATIAASAYPCVIFCHYPVYYLYPGQQSWGLTNAAAVRTIIDAAGSKVIACVCGHIHDNHIRKVGSCVYATLDAVSSYAYPAVNHSIVTVYPDLRRIKIIAAGYHMSEIPG